MCSVLKLFLLINGFQFAVQITLTEMEICIIKYSCRYSVLYTLHRNVYVCHVCGVKDLSTFTTSIQKMNDLVSI
jgi:hypothetical protein